AESGVSAALGSAAARQLSATFGASPYPRKRRAGLLRRRSPGLGRDRRENSPNARDRCGKQRSSAAPRRARRLASQETLRGGAIVPRRQAAYFGNRASGSTLSTWLVGAGMSQ